jgi:hypothetical protein
LNQVELNNRIYWEIEFIGTFQLYIAKETRLNLNLCESYTLNQNTSPGHVGTTAPSRSPRSWPAPCMVRKHRSAAAVLGVHVEERVARDNVETTPAMRTRRCTSLASARSPAPAQAANAAAVATTERRRVRVFV